MHTGLPPVFHGRTIGGHDTLAGHIPQMRSPSTTSDLHVGGMRAAVCYLHLALRGFRLASAATADDAAMLVSAGKVFPMWTH